ncbi:MAG: hypothetical protein JWO92_682 [Chitinophagaceae bacterium]|nr:hypothetical protein [Chitinophagaceae bacterium]MDB5222385.1 hypothetical protein [Chitinophagaceae bacterium]
MAKPANRKLRGYAFDPSLSLTMDTASFNQILYKVQWEDLQLTEQEKNKQLKDASYVPQGVGPTGEYIEVLDYDPTVDKFYEPVDLNDSYILAQDGLDPSESNPQFHQQMVYAVMMTTIKNFENALGRKVLWAPRRVADYSKYEEYVQRLRVYPHAFRDSNAYYSPLKKALLFGYFSSAPADETLSMPNALVFTCLSHDIIAHETTHAILDGMHRYYNESTNPDVLAFHEAFSDIVALFQHFTFPEVLKNQIAKTRGDLAEQSLLGQLAQQFGSAIGSYGSLRDAIGEIDEVTKKWKPKKPDADDYRNVMEPHKRGSILVSAVFEAFINIYKSRVSDLLRIASNGTGILPQGELHPDLVNRLAGEASKSASHVLTMCIRAIDYCPPVDITFGEYLRAIITADVDIVAEDRHDYRLAFIDAFRKRGIYAQGLKTLSVESLQYTRKPVVSPEVQTIFNGISDFLRDFRREVMYKNDREVIFNTSKTYIAGKYYDKNSLIDGLHHRIFVLDNSTEFEKITGIVFNKNWESFGVRTSEAYKDKQKGPSIQIQNLRLVARVGPNGEQINQIVLSLVQRCGVILKDGMFNGHFVPDDTKALPAGGCIFRGGCTMIFDLDTLALKYAISKPLIDIAQWDTTPQIDKTRIENQYNYQNDANAMGVSEFQKYFSMGLSGNVSEPFALLHQS